MTSETRGLAGNHTTAASPFITHLRPATNRAPSCVLETFVDFALHTHNFPIPGHAWAHAHSSLALLMPSLLKAPIMISSKGTPPKNPSSAIRNQITRLVNPYQATMPTGAAHDPATSQDTFYHRTLPAWRIPPGSICNRGRDERPTEHQLCRNNGQRIATKLLCP